MILRNRLTYSPDGADGAAPETAEGDDDENNEGGGGGDDDSQ